MAKKLIRISNPKLKDLETYINQEVSLVLNNKSVYLGKIKKVKLTEVTFSDNLFNKRVFIIENIQELIVDQIHSF